MSPSRSQLPSTRSSVLRWIGLILVVLVFAVLVSQRQHLFSLQEFAARETQLRHFIEQHPFLAIVIGYAVYSVATGLSIPGATILTLVYGWLFGFWRGLLVVSFASTSGATLAFLLSRFFFREALQRRFESRLQSFNTAIEREGPYYLLTLRLIPAVPFFVINVVMGLTPMNVGTFWWISQLGMFPATAVYVSAGANVPDLNALAERGVGSLLTWPLLASCIALGLLPILIKRWLPKRLSRQNDDPASTPPSS